MRLAVLSGLLLWPGAVLLLSESRWFARRPLADRLRPYGPAGGGVEARGLLSLESFREVIGPLARDAGARLSRLFGVSEELSARLLRIHSPHDVTSFRVRQFGGALGGLVVAGLVALAARPPLLISVFLLIGVPLLVFLSLEQRVAAQSAARQRRVFLELPVVAEQLAMLLTAGYSLSAALNRLAARGHGACAEDLRVVMSRVRQGLTEVDAIREWAALARVDALDRLVPVLSLNTEAGDLGRLVSDEARSIRADVQRDLVETMERRSQSVWVPVTIATLVPGVILLAIPFAQALRLFTSG
jgi:Flp pilus assembly protein TadB